MIQAMRYLDLNFNNPEDTILRTEEKKRSNFILKYMYITDILNDIYIMQL